MDWTQIQGINLGYVNPLDIIVYLQTTYLRCATVEVAVGWSRYNIGVRQNYFPGQLGPWNRG